MRSLFEYHAPFHPIEDFSDFLKQIPAKPAVYLLADADDRPVQLLWVKNLRVSLQRRLGEQPPDEPKSKRLDCRALVRNVHWQRVDSDFEADLVYLDTARTLFPDTYQGMIGFRLPWWIHIDPDADFPRYTRTTTPASQPGQHLGPLNDKHAAARLIELTQDLFDLCRYHHILIQAPRGKACAYKEMSKCPAPCDGSISMPSYRRMIARSAQTLADPAPFIAEHQQRMKQAAADLHFESAAKIRSLLDQADTLGKGHFRHVRPLDQFTYLTLQPAPRPQCKLFLILQGQIHQPLCLLNLPSNPASLIDSLHESAAALTQTALDTPAIERMAIATHHLFAPKGPSFIHLDNLTPDTLRAAWRKLQKQPPAPETPDEGLRREL